MSQATDEAHGRLQEDDAKRSRQHHSAGEWGSIPGAVRVAGTFVTECCDAVPFSVYNHGGVRSGTCQQCGEFSKLKLVKK